MHLKYAANAIAILLAVLSLAQTPEKNPRTLGPSEFTAYKTPTPPKLDGEVDPAEWAGASTSSRFMNYQHQPEKGESTFYLSYDEKNIYFAVVARKTFPPKANIRGTNVSFGPDDTVTFSIDTFGEGKYDGFNYCTVNALGATNFRKAGGSSQKREWLGECEAAGKILPDGWSVEGRVPWNILRIPQSGIRDLKFNFSRSDTRAEEFYYYFQAKDTDVTTGCLWKGVDVPKVETKNLWKFLPSINAFASRKDIQSVASLDMRGFLNDKYELSAVLFPDFTLINRVRTQLGFSHFEILGPETRPIFQEGSGYFSGVSPIFVSQRIRKFDLGMRLYGSPNPKTKIGINSTVAFDGEETLAGSWQSSIGPNSNYQLGIASNRGHGQAGNEAIAAAFDTSRGPWSGQLSGALSNDGAGGMGHSIGIGGNYFHGNLNGFGGFSHVDRRFFPRLGYVPETGVEGANIGFNYGFDSERKWLSGAGFGIGHGLAWKTGGQSAHESTSVSGNISLRRIVSAYLSASRGTFDNQSESGYSAYVSMPNSRAPWSLDFSYSGNRFGDSYSRFADVSAGYADPRGKWALSAGITDYKSGTTAIQRYLSFGYKLGIYDNISISLLDDQGKTNGSLQFARRNNRGIEYYIAFGDPSAERFTPALIGRVVIPIK